MLLAPMPALAVKPGLAGMEIRWGREGGGEEEREAWWVHRDRRWQEKGGGGNNRKQRGRKGCPCGIYCVGLSRPFSVMPHGNP